MVNIHLDLSLIDLLLIFSIWMCHFDPVVSLGIESTSKLLSGYECFPPVFWCHFENKIVLYHYLEHSINHFPL